MLQRRKALLEQGFEARNGAHEPMVNRFLKACNSAKLKYLIYGTMSWLLVSSVFIAYVFIERGCVNEGVTFTNCLLLVLSMLLGGAGPEVNQTDCCPTVSVLAAVVSFMTDSMIIAIFVQRVTSPQAKIITSSNVLLKMRNNRLLFQIRYMNAFGHPLEHVSVNACYYRLSVSDEGETFTNIVPIKFQCNYVCHAPQNVSHIIDENSPFYGEELENFVGTLEITISGYDSTLGASSSSTTFYDKTVVLIAHEWESVFNESPQVGVKRFSVDCSKLSSAGPSSPELAAKIHDAISWNKFNRDVGGSAVPNVLKTLHGGKPLLGQGVSEKQLFLTERNRSQVLNRPVGTPERPADIDLSLRHPVMHMRAADSPVTVGSDGSVEDEAEGRASKKLNKSKLLSFSMLRNRHKHGNNG